LASMSGESGTHRPDYYSFLVRLWRVTAEGGPAWRGSVQRPGSAEVVGFAGLEELCRLLREEVGEQEAGAPDEG
jgi:hypothetical protein